MAIEQHRDLITELEDISIYALDKCMKGDLRYMLRGYEFGEVEVPENIEEAWNELYNKWMELTATQDSVLSYSLLLEINFLEQSLAFAPILLREIIKPKPKKIKLEFYKELSAWGFPMSPKKPLEDEVERITRMFRARKSKLDLKKAEYEEESKESKPMSLISQKVKMERALKINIDVKKTSAIEWIAYIDELKEMANNSRQREQQDNGDN